MSKRAKYVIGRTGFYAIVIVLFLFMISPIVWIAATSLQPYKNLTSIPPRIEAGDSSFAAYHKLFGDANFLDALGNTVIITTATSVLSIALASLTAFVMAFFTFRYKNGILFLMTSIQMAPAIALLIPLFMLLRALALIDTYLGTIVVMALFITPLAAWMLKSFFQEIPRELLEAARIDGCGRLGAMFRIVLPLGTSGILATFIFCFITSWNELLIPLTVTLARANTLTMYASAFAGSYEIDFAGAAAVSVLSSIPTIVLALLFRKYLVQGLLEGAVRG
mgnify:CR=1 FL=1